ncbi:MAG: HPF/RaiA family ribosome-associated protein [Candidatus Latescibacterota bacterium]
MEVPLELSYRGIERTDALDELIRSKVAQLERVCDHIVSCRIAVEKAQARQQTGSPFRVRIDMRVPPGHELVVARETTDNAPHEDLPTVLRGAFEAARQQLRELSERQRGNTKTHALSRGG